jgi:hypothetical protein
MHDRRDLPQAQSIDRYWDEVFQGEPAGSDLGTLDPDLVATVQRVHALDAAPTADPAFGARLWAELMHAHGIADNLRQHPMPDSAALGQAAAPHRRPATTPFGAPPTRRRWGFAQFATAAVLLLILGLVYWALGPGRADDGPRDTIPGAAPTEPSVPTAATEGPVLKITLPAAALPRGDGVSSGLAHFIIPPGTGSTWEPNCCPGPLVEYVLRGTYSVRAEAAIQIVRADGTVEEVPAGTGVTLGPGDGLISRNETVVEAANVGATPVELLGWVLVEEGGFQGHSLPGWVMGGADVQGPLAVPAGPAELRLRRVELAPGAAITPPPGSLSFVVVLPQNAAGTPVPTFYGRQTDGTLRNPSSQNAITVYVLTMEPVGGEAGSPVAVSPTP